MMEDARAAGEESLLFDGEAPTAATVAAAAQAGDALALRIYGKSAETLGSGLALLVDILNPECIVIGSVYARNEELFREKMPEVLVRQALPASLAACRILPAALGESIGDVAALSVAMLW